MFFDKIVKIEKNYVERVENINIKVYTSGVDNMQIDHLREWFLNPFFSQAKAGQGIASPGKCKGSGNSLS